MILEEDLEEKLYRAEGYRIRLENTILVEVHPFMSLLLPSIFYNFNN